MPAPSSRGVNMLKWFQSQTSTPLANVQVPLSTNPPSTGSTLASPVGVDPEISVSGSSPQTSSCASASNMPCIQLWLATTVWTQAVEPHARPSSAAMSTWIIWSISYPPNRAGR